MTKPAENVCRALDLKTSKILKVFNNNNVHDSQQLLKIHFFFTLRSVICGFFGIAQVLDFSQVRAKSKEKLRLSIMKGKQPMFKGTNEVVIRLCGE